MDSSFESIGTTVYFKEVREREISKETQSIILEFYINITILIVVYIIILVEMSKSTSCSIPVREWCLLFFTLWLGKGCLNMFKILVMRKAYESRICFSFSMYMILNSLLVIWVVIGSIWFFSATNDCDQHSATVFFYWLMMILLIVGYVIILFYLICLFLIPCLIIRAQNKQDRAFKETGEFETEKDRSWVLQKLS